MGIQYESTVFGDVRLGQISAAPGLGAVLLRFTLIWTLHPRRDHTYSVFGTYLRVSAGPEGKGKLLHLGHAVPEVAWCDETRDGSPIDRPLMYRLTLQADQLLALEQLRQGLGMRFMLELRGNSLGPSGVCQVDSTLQVSATQSDWVRLLQEANAKDILLVGVELPLRSPSATFGPALELGVARTGFCCGEKTMPQSPSVGERLKVSGRLLAWSSPL